ncbi:MAG: 23S rRNA (uracil(1939)-C(5))-methyltransferase RlmD [Oscillochloris sp.]|nr:23S rRNA (uracil(1939)-C(5))-methyltransferase RlmD [Oscillochloris sp.]
MRSKEFRNLVVSLARANEPVEPRCPHAEQCGGCAFQDRAYNAQIAAKTTALTRLFKSAENLPNLVDGTPFDLDRLEFAVEPSPDPYTYRTRMDYVATKGRFGLRARGKFNYIVELETCHLIPPPAFAAAKAVWVRANELGIPDYNIRSHEGFLRYVVVRRSPADQLLLAAVTALGPYEAEMEQLAATALAQPGVTGFHWLLNDSKTDLSFGTPLRHWGVATLPMPVGAHELAIGPNTFFQNNVHLLDQLLSAVRDAALADLASPPRIADLYGGVGTIALHLAPAAAEVVCVESVAESVALAKESTANAGISNLRPVFADVASFLQETAPETFPIMIADPPRTGLGPEVCAELNRLKPERIVYVSCNPLTQVEDLQALAGAYSIRSLRGYDMFPHTPHVESIAVLER